MSNDGSASQSSNSSSSQENLMELQIPDSCDSTFIRSGTVVRRTPFRDDRVTSTSSTEDDDAPPNERYRKDFQYRHSLTAISERRNLNESLLSKELAKISNRPSLSLDYSTSDGTNSLIDVANRQNGLDHKCSASLSSSSYLSWIESVNSEYFETVISNELNEPDHEVDNKVGEWNNFWLNYSNSRLCHLSTAQTFSSDGIFDKTVDDQSEDRKSLGSTQKDVTEKNSLECVILTVDEVQETIRCSQRITEILQNAMKRSEPDEGSNESYYSQQISANLTQMVGEDKPTTTTSTSMLNRERSISCVDHQTIQRHQKQMLKPSKQSSSTSCIDAILNSSVGDMLKKVVMKRRQASVSELNGKPSSRNSFSEWTNR